MSHVQVPYLTACTALEALHETVENLITHAAQLERYTPEWERAKENRDHAMRHADTLQAIIDRFETEETAAIEERYR